MARSLPSFGSTDVATSMVVSVTPGPGSTKLAKLDERVPGPARDCHLTPVPGQVGTL